MKSNQRTGEFSLGILSSFLAMEILWPPTKKGAQASPSTDVFTGQQIPWQQNEIELTFASHVHGSHRAAPSHIRPRHLTHGPICGQREKVREGEGRCIERKTTALLVEKLIGAESVLLLLRPSATPCRSSTSGARWVEGERPDGGGGSWSIMAELAGRCHSRSPSTTSSYSFPRVEALVDGSWPPPPVSPRPRRTRPAQPRVPSPGPPQPPAR
jgi:hypothetical protein